MLSIPEIDPVEVILLALAAIIVAGPAVNTLMDSFLGIKEKVVDRKASKIIDAAIQGDDSLREEILNRFDHADEEHVEFREMFDNDKRDIDQLKRDVDTLRKRQDGAEIRLDDHETELKDRAEGEKVVITALKAILNEKIGIGTTADLVDAVGQIDSFLIEGRKK